LTSAGLGTGDVSTVEFRPRDTSQSASTARQGCSSIVRGSRPRSAALPSNRRLDRRLPNGRNRRISLVAGRPGEGPLTEPIAATQPRRQEPLFMPRNGRCRREGATARSGGELPFPISSACDAHGLIADPHASVARIAAKRRVAVITPAFPLAATRLPLGIQICLAVRLLHQIGNRFKIAACPDSDCG